MQIIIPDKDGRATLDQSSAGIISRIKALHPDAVVTTILNGPNRTQLREIALAAKDVQALVCPGTDENSHDNDRGMVGATLFGYEQALARRWGGPIIKLDSAEHDPAFIAHLVNMAEKYGAAIGDLDFSAGGLTPGSYDYWIHTEVFPNLYGACTEDKLRLSCAHGFQAYRRDVLIKAMNTANQIVVSVEIETGKLMQWGLDGAIALSALKSGCDVQVIKVPAVTKRDRDVGRINSQLRHHMHVIAAAMRIW